MYSEHTTARLFIVLINASNRSGTALVMAINLNGLFRLPAAAHLLELRSDMVLQFAGIRGHAELWRCP